MTGLCFWLFNFDSGEAGLCWAVGLWGGGVGASASAGARAGAGAGLEFGWDLFPHI